MSKTFIETLIKTMFSLFKTKTKQEKDTDRKAYLQEELVRISAEEEIDEAIKKSKIQGKKKKKKKKKIIIGSSLAGLALLGYLGYYLFAP